MTPAQRQVERIPAGLLEDLGLPGVRWLGAGDGERLVELVRACYGDTYSYASLYDAAEVEARWAEGSLLSLGHLDEAGRLDGHTGFWRKDPADEHVESGLSLIRPGARRGFAVDPAAMWQALLERWSRFTGLIHQNTTTRHPRAQLYAARHMRARPTGWIFDYALGETLVGLAETPAPMHALTMSTVLRPGVPGPGLAVPQGPWAGWLTELVRGVLPAAVVTSVACSAERVALALAPIEHNPSLALRRQRVVDVAGSPTPTADSPSSAPARVVLVHLPMEGPRVAASWSSLLARGFVPVGVRPHLQRASEIVLQATTIDHAREAIATMSLAGARVRSLADGWLEACAHTS